MDFDYSPAVVQRQARLNAFFDEFVYPNEQRYHQEGGRHRAQCEFLALIDVVFHGNAVLRVGLEGESGFKRNDPGQQHQQRAGSKEGDEHPHPARRMHEMKQQRRDEQQLQGRPDGMDALGP